MEKKDLVNLLNELFIPLGYKRKGNNWSVKNPELTKVINLQKSNFSKSYYINYGYIINNLELTTVLHIDHRLGSIDKSEQNRITELLDLESTIAIEDRLSELKIHLTNKIVTETQSINTELDLLNKLKRKKHLMIPKVVMNYFSLD